MTPRDFAFWLQGYFELALTSKYDWNDDRIKDLIKKHLDLVKATQGNYSSEMVQFIGWMDSAIEFDIPASNVKAKLNSLFEHVIDPATDSTSDIGGGFGNQIHHGSDYGARC